MVAKGRNLRDSRTKLKSKIKMVSKRETRLKPKVLRKRRNVLPETDLSEVAVVDLAGLVSPQKGFTRQTDSDVGNSEMSDCRNSDIAACLKQASETKFVETTNDTLVMIITPSDGLSDCQAKSDKRNNRVAKSKPSGKKNKKKKNVKKQAIQQSLEDSVSEKGRSKRGMVEEYQHTFKNQRNWPKFDLVSTMNSYKKRLQKEAVADNEQVHIAKSIRAEISGSEEVSGEASRDFMDSECSHSEVSDEDVLLDAIEREEALFRVFGHDQVEVGSCGVFGSGVNDFKFHGSGGQVEDEGMGEDVHTNKQSKEKTEGKNASKVDDSMPETKTNLGCVSLSLSNEEACLVILRHPQELCIQGKARVTMVMGHMTIMGYRLQPEEEHKVYSPLSNSYSVLKTVDASDQFKRLCDKVFEIMEHRNSVQHYKSKLDEIRGGKFVAFLVQPLDCEAHNYISGMSPYNGLFTIRTDVPMAHNAELLPLGLGLFPREYVMRPWLKLSKDIMQILELWASMISREDNSGRERAPVILVCGGKNSGKSTLGRHLVNAALNVLKVVDYLELDIGQPEFSLPGCLALHRVTEPVLGPPFSHVRKPERMCYYGGVTADVNVPLYAQCVEYVFAAYKGDNPLIINTMGWNTGLGLKLLVDVLHVTNPDVVVQIDTYKPADNFPPVTPSFKADTEGWSRNLNPGEQPAMKETVPHELCVVQTPVRKMQEKFITWMPADHRNVQLLSYFCAALAPGRSLLSLTPYTVPWSAVSVHVADFVDIPASRVLLVLNASVVALCRSDLSVAESRDDRYPRILHEFPMCPCLGFGLIRGIDVETKLLYIVTPMVLDELAQVNVLVKGSLSLPDQVIKQQKSEMAKPYWDSVTRSTGSWKMSLKQRKMRRPGAVFRSRQK